MEGVRTDKIIWWGTQEESFAIVSALANNCTCEFNPNGIREETCEPHKMLTEDQRALDGLIFMRRMAQRLRDEEFNCPDPDAS